MKYRLIFFSIIIFFSVFKKSAAQDCDCESNFQWVKATFEENDAGFQYILDKKGRQAYDIHNILIFEKVKSAKTLTECTRLLYEWLQFFRSGHIGIELTEYGSEEGASKTALYEMVEGVDIPEFEKYVAQKTEAGFEGIWEIGAYKIGIKKEGEDYTGFIIDTDIKEWSTGQIKLRIIKEKEKYRSVFYLRNHYPQESDRVQLMGNRYLLLGGNVLKRISPSFPDEKEVEGFIRSMETPSAYLERLTETTLLLRIPSFDYGHKAAIDSVIFANKREILATPHLIIDLRDNGGGSDQSFAEIIPFLYTNPIRTIGVEFLSTELNREAMFDYATNPEYGFDEETINWAKDAYDKMKQYPNRFVTISYPVIDMEKQDTVYRYPENVAILINENNASSVEQFLLAAKQSRKVKLFGATTGGALDISNMNDVESPCKQFRLWYCMSKSHRIPGMTIDDMGLQPDYYIDNTIPDYHWVKFVMEMWGME